MVVCNVNVVLNSFSLQYNELYIIILTFGTKMSFTFICQTGSSFVVSSNRLQNLNLNSRLEIRDTVLENCKKPTQLVIDLTWQC